MKNLKLALAIVSMIAITGLLCLPRRSEPAAEFSKPLASGAASFAPGVAPATVPVPATAPTTAPSRPLVNITAPDLPKAANPSVASHLVSAEQVLATVNGKAIRLADLVSLAPDERQRTMTAEQYESRLNRAIEMELTFQAAQARAVELTPEQRQRLNRVEQHHQSALAKFKPGGISWSSVTPPQLEFEKRLMSALMLQQNLVAKEAAVAPSPDAVVQAQYERALQDILAGLRAAANINVPSGKDVWSADFRGMIRSKAAGGTPEDLPVFSPDGKVVAVGSTNGSVCLLSAASGEVLRQ